MKKKITAKGSGSKGGQKTKESSSIGTVTDQGAGTTDFRITATDEDAVETTDLVGTSKSMGKDITTGFVGTATGQDADVTDLFDTTTLTGAEIKTDFVGTATGKNLLESNCRSDRQMQYIEKIILVTLICNIS